MKKLVISTLIAGISATAPLYAQTAAADSIEQQVFDKSFDVAVLSPQEMRETEGAYSVAGSIIGASALNGAYSVGLTNIMTMLRYGELASAKDNALSFAIGAGTGAFSSVVHVGQAVAAGQAGTPLSHLKEGLNGVVLFTTAYTDAAIAYATFPRQDPNLDP